MDTLEIIALIAEPDSDARMASIKRLALLETQPKIDIEQLFKPQPRLDIKSVQPSPFPNVAVSVVLSNDNQVDLKHQDIEQINELIPKPAFEPAEVCGVTKTIDVIRNTINYKLSLNDGSYCYINENKATELYTFIPRPIVEHKIKGWTKHVGTPIQAELDTGDILDISDLQIAAMYNRLVKVENKSRPMDELVEMLDKLSKPNYDLCDILEDYKRWRRMNM
jgi:hypothetical protein